MLVPCRSSESDYQVVFVIGAPRSGTTWVQLMLGDHPAIATGQETDLFNNYIAPLSRRWNEDLRTTEDRRFKGLTAVLTQEEFDKAVYDFISAVYSKIRSLKPTASLVLDKNPPYSLQADLLTRYWPDARFIHVLRDGRDVVTSLLAASNAWAQSWAPKKTRTAAKTWRRHVEGARRAGRSEQAYIEVRYEDLLKRGPSELARLFEFCGIHTTPEDCVSIYERFSFANIKSSYRQISSIIRSGEIERRYGPQLEEPEGFFREGEAGTWKTVLTKRQCRIIEEVAGDLLEELGYGTSAGEVRGSLLVKLGKMFMTGGNPR